MLKLYAGLKLHTLTSIANAKQKIRKIIATSHVPEDPRHADNTLEWLLHLAPNASDSLQLAALAHDIDRAIDESKVKREQFDDFNVFKEAHAHNSAIILRPILTACSLEKDVVDEACRLVELHEVGGDLKSDLIKDADSISYFDVNLPLYYKREGLDETKRRSLWGYHRLSPRAKKIVNRIVYENKTLTHLLTDVINECSN